jgi:hypothetical protein
MSLSDVFPLEIVDPSCRCLEWDYLVPAFHIGKPAALPNLTIASQSMVIVWMIILMIIFCLLTKYDLTVRVLQTFTLFCLELSQFTYFGTYFQLHYYEFGMKFWNL